jgi:spermidine/putrescine transport system permease protein
LAPPRLQRQAGIVYGLELLEAATLGLAVAIAVSLIRGGESPTSLIPRFLILCGGGYLILRSLALLWLHSAWARTLLTWLSLGFVYFPLLLLDLNQEFLLSRVYPEAVRLPRVSDRAREWLTGLSWESYLFLYLPIIVLVVFSFNAATVTEGGRTVGATVWRGFTTYWYEVLIHDRRILDAVQNTLLVAVIATAISTVIGTMAALVMERYEFLGKLPFDALLYLPIIIPDIVMALALLLFFVIIHLPEWSQGVITWVAQMAFLPAWLSGFVIRLIRVTPIIIAHVAFNISFVAVVVRARLANLDRTLEEAAQDLGANEWQTFRRVTLPLLMPGIIGGALLAFTLSTDDFVIAFFVSGPGATTLPVRVYSMIRIGVTPEANAVSSVMLLASIVLVLLSLALQRRSPERP